MNIVESVLGQAALLQHYWGSPACETTALIAATLTLVRACAAMTQSRAAGQDGAVCDGGGGERVPPHRPQQHI